MAEQNLDFNIIAHTQGMEQIANLINRVGALEAETKKLAAANTTLAKSTDTVIRNGTRYNTALDAQSKAIRNSRMGVNQLGMQFNDLGTSISTGASPIQAFNQQLGQMGYALSMMEGKAGKLGDFLAGPWGAAIVLATMALGFLAEGFLNSGNAADSSAKSIDKLVEEKRKSAIASENAEKADEAFRRTLEGVLFSIKANKKAMEGLNAVKVTSAQTSLIAANATYKDALATQANTQQKILNAKALFQAQLSRAASPGQAGEQASMGLGSMAANIKSLTQEYNKATFALSSAFFELNKAQAFVSVERGQRSAEDSINSRYDAQIDGARRAALASGAVGRALQSEIAGIEAARTAELDRFADSEKAGSRAESAAKRLANARERELTQANQIAEKIRDMALVYGAANKEVGTTAKKLDDFNDMVQKLGTLTGGPALLQQLAGGIELVRNAIVGEGADKAFSDLNEEMDKLLKKDLTPFEQAISSLNEKMNNPELGEFDAETTIKYYASLNSAAGKFFDDAIKSERDLFNKAMGVDDAFQMQVASLERIIASMTAANIPADALVAKLKEFQALNEDTKMAERNKELQDSFDAIGNAVANSFKGMLTGAMSFKSAMKSIIGAVIDELFRLYVVKQIVGIVSGALGGATGTSASGGVDAGIRFAAQGGSVGKNQPHIVGERGPELFIPGGSGTIIPNNNMRNGGGGSNFNITVDARGSNDPAAVRAQVQQGILEAAPAIIAAAESRTIAGLRRPRLGGAMQ